MLGTKIRRTIAALVASASLAGVAVAPAVSQADQKSGGGTATTCGGSSKPGDIMETTTTITINGKWDMTVKTKEICGSDGKWHVVVNLETGKGSNRPVGAPPVVARPLLP